jgi:predicted acetyltransferase/ADP-ribose pyrophosphatase YjhB (NUDIX family)
MSSTQHFPEPTVGALIFDPEGRLFLMRSHKWAGKYVVPGGHVELGETLEAALRREVAEETNLSIHDIRFVGIQEFIHDPAFWQPRHFIFFDYACRTDETTVRLNDEAQEYVWATVDEALRLPIEPYTEVAIQTYLAQRAAGQRRTPVDRAAVRLVPAERPALANLLELYLHEFSAFDDAEIGADGRYGYVYLDTYWAEPGRTAFLIQVDGRLAGFALVRTVEAGENPLYSIAEFFVLRKYRRLGVGRAAAQAIFDLFPGRWQVNQDAANLAAKAFWRRVIGDYTGGRLTEGWQAGEEPVGPVQRFHAGGQPPG